MNTGSGDSSYLRAVELPFSESELYRAHRVFVDHAEAAREVAELLRTVAEQRRALEECREDPARYAVKHGYAESESPAFGVSLSEDFLVVLSLLSDDLADRVVEYAAIEPSQRNQWEARRAELRATVANRLEQLR